MRRERFVAVRAPKRPFFTSKLLLAAPGGAAGAVGYRKAPNPPNLTQKVSAERPESPQELLGVSFLTVGATKSRFSAPKTPLRTSGCYGRLYGAIACP